MYTFLNYPFRYSSWAPNRASFDPRVQWVPVGAQLRYVGVQSPDAHPLAAAVVAMVATAIRDAQNSS